MRLPLGKEWRKIYLRKIKEFGSDYLRNRLGLAGLSIILIFLITAIFAPVITPYDQFGSPDVAYRFAKPAWITVFPQYKNLPPTKHIWLNWSTSSSEIVDVQIGEKIVVNYTGGIEETEICLITNFSYAYDAPPGFDMSFRWKAILIPENEIGYNLELVLVRWNDGESYSLWDSNVGKSWKINTQYSFKSVRSEPLYPGKSVLIDSRNAFFVKERFGPDFFGELWANVSLGEPSPYLSKILFSEKGEYGLLMYMRFKPNSENATCEIILEGMKEFRILGYVHGILGTDSFGGDIMAQLIYGTRISLMIGALTAALVALFGLTVGVVAGYVGGVFDQVSMRAVDSLLCLPIFPLVMALTKLYGQTVFNIVILVTIFEWVYLARIVRAKVFTLKEMSFIESAKAVGAGRLHIMIKHIVPNVLPIVFASLVLEIPTPILTEAALSFLGFGDPTVMTWGKMLHYANEFGGFRYLIWWWILPPGLALMALSLAFVFVGHALDEILNPRLRRRR